jgi:hypothetical protein
MVLSVFRFFGVQNRKYLIYFGSQKTKTEFHNGSFGSVSSVSVLDYFGSVPVLCTGLYGAPPDRRQELPSNWISNGF